ncbi:D-alanyl-D-alanine carboxypeptidase family protein [Thermodesulfobacteriota bacterium]
MDLNELVEIPRFVRKIPQRKVGIRPGDLLTVKDLLHGMLIVSGNDCAAVLAAAYPKGGRKGFIAAMNRKAAVIGARKTRVFTASGLDLRLGLGRKAGRSLVTKKSNVASAQDVATIARHAFSYPLIREISRMKSHIMKPRNSKKRKYVLRTNDRLLSRQLPVDGAKTGYTDLAGRCIVARFKDEDGDYIVVVLNSRRHFNTAEKVYKWACETF